MQKIAILYDASQAVLSTFDLDEVLKRILVIARDYFHLQSAAVLLLDQKTNELRVRLQVGWDKEYDDFHVQVGTGIIGLAARQKRPVNSVDVSKDPRYVPCVKTTKSELAIPLMVRDDVVGVLDCQSDQVAHFDSETTDLLTLFSTQASMALQNAQLYTLERRRASQLKAINTIAQQMTAVLDPHELLSKVCVRIQEELEIPHVSVLLKEEDELVLRAQHGKFMPLVEDGARFPANHGLCGSALSTSRIVVENVADVPDHIPLYKETVSRICVPLISFGQILGVLLADSDLTSAFESNETQPLRSVADICATAIQNAKYVDRVKQLAYLDGLTGIHNRRYFEMRIAEEIERARRFNQHMAIVMIDIDHFKDLNDEFGHILGDEVLRQVSSILHQQLRKIDVVCRYGGEEFVVLLSQTDAQVALRVAEKLRRTIEGWQFPGVPRSVTISAGTATCPEDGMTRDELVKAADAGLYAAKQSGRNRVCRTPGKEKGAARTAGQ